MDGYVIFGLGMAAGILVSYLMSDLVFEHKEFGDEGECDNY
jgi:hypothetical protein